LSVVVGVDVVVGLVEGKMDTGEVDVKVRLLD